MNVLTILFLGLCLSFCVEGAQVSVVNGPTTFSITLSGGKVNFTRNGMFYPTLSGLTGCTDGSTPVSLGNNQWQCGPVDTLLALSSQCSNTSATFPLPKFVGGSFQCLLDNDTAKALSPNCSENQIVKFQGGQWVCATDSNQAANLTTSCSSETLQWNGSAFVCVGTGSVPDSNILGALTSCSTNQVAKYNGTAWVCSSDANSLPTGCSAGSILLYNSSLPGWTCGSDSDILLTAGTVTGCAGNATFPKYRNGAWACQDLYWVFSSKKKRSEEEVQAVEQSTAQLLLVSTSTTYTVFPTTPFTVTWGAVSQSGVHSSAGVTLPTSGTIQTARMTFRSTTFPAGSFRLNVTTTTSSSAQLFTHGAINSTTALSVTTNKFALPVAANQRIQVVVTPLYTPSAVTPGSPYGFYTLELYIAV